jgi:hypothetical protein
MVLSTLHISVHSGDTLLKAGKVADSTPNEVIDLFSISLILSHVSCVPLSPQHGASSGCGWRDGLQLGRVAMNILNRQLRTNDKGWFSTCGLDMALTTLHHKYKLVTESLHEPGELL